MNLDAIIKKLSKSTNFSVTDTEKIVNIILNSFKNFLKNNEKIELRGLGSFYLKKRKPREINLKTKYIKSVEHYGIIFRESYNLKKIINKGVYN